MVFLSALWGVMLELAPWLLLGAGVAGLLHAVLPPGFVHRNLQGAGGVVKAVLLGVPLPLCSCGVIPAGLGLKRDGASDGASVGFLIATPQTGVDSLLVSASFLGWPFAIFKLLSAAFLGLVGGLSTHVLSPGEVIEAPPATDGKRPGLKAGFEHSVEVIRSIWGWLLFGVVVSAVLTVAVPPGAFAGLGEGGGWLAMFAMLGLSLPLYVCATASVPIAAALVAGGFPVGAALVFLMAGPATNVATIGAVRQAFGTKTVVIYLTTIIAGSMALGWAFDFVLEGQLHGHGHHEHGAGPVAWVTAVVLSLMVGRFAFEDGMRWFRSKRPAPAAVNLGVQGMTCNGCVRKLEAALTEAGATTVVIEREPDRVSVAGIDEAAVIAVIESKGYTYSRFEELEFDVSGLTCNGCVNKLKGRFEAAEGVQSFEVSRNEEAADGSGKAVVSGMLSAEAVRGIIEEAGFEVASPS